MKKFVLVPYDKFQALVEKKTLSSDLAGGLDIQSNIISVPGDTAGLSQTGEGPVVTPRHTSTPTSRDLEIPPSVPHHTRGVVPSGSGAKKEDVEKGGREEDEGRRGNRVDEERLETVKALDGSPEAAAVERGPPGILAGTWLTWK